MYCPYCHKHSEWHIPIREENRRSIFQEKFVYKCKFCSEKFTEQDSLDYEWDEMIKMCAKTISPSDCIRWIKGEIPTNHTFEFDAAFNYHFGISPKKIKKDEIMDLEIRIKRENILNGLL